ncbi:hypothetical protein G7046_g5664 [Stylonectria norvegica]|nr:hypothetical protein G7046_g5664 [Stylonectria norvegica]
MSGFEVAGIVLGAFPLAISALEKYREVAKRLGLFRNIRLEYKRCRDALVYQQLIFKRHLKQLLLPLVADDDDSKIAKLLSDPGGDMWKESSIADLLEERLQESYELYLEYIKGMGRVMDELNQELAAESQPVQDSVTTPKLPMSTERIKHIVSKDGRAFQSYKIKFSNGEGVRKKLFDDLQAYNDKLEKLLDSGDKDTQLQQQRALRVKTTEIDTAICNFWIQARRLFKVLMANWNCRSSCWIIHDTTISEGDKGATLTRSPSVMSKVQTQQPILPNHRQNALLKSDMRSKTNTTCVQLLKAPAVTMPSVKISARSASSTGIGINCPITSVCTSLEQAQGPCCGYLADDDFRYYIYPTSRKTTDKFQSVSLDQILRGEVLPQPSRTQRYTLSLTVASSVLQLLDSPWLPRSLRKTDIVFLRDARDPKILRLDEPRVNRELVGQLQQPALGPASQTPTFSESLDFLGIILLELCFGRILEDHAYRKKWSAGQNDQERAVFDIMAARDWQCHVNEEAGFDYAEAVAWCLGGNRSTPPDRWRQDMLRKVIQPLQRCRDYLVTGGVGI